MDKKTQEHAHDITRTEVVSDCCGVHVFLEDICGECREHCTPIVLGEE